jgi:protein dithiol oxidoreductase (disulfide-forming)
MLAIRPTLALCAAAALAAALFVSPTPAATAPPEGTTFKALVPPRLTGNPDKIEVTEFFSYGCPHCANFAPLISTWTAKLPKDVVFRRVPVGFGRDAWINLQRAYYALQLSGDLGRLDGALFDAIHEKHLPLFDEPRLADWVAHNGGNGDKFAAAYVSFGVNNQTVQADQMAQDYAIDSVPAMAIDGKYLAMADPASGEMPYLVELLANTDRLIARARAERAASGAAPRTAKPAGGH